MFNKKKCKKCGEKINNKYSYCPYCGVSFNSDAEDWGMLGKRDLQDPFEEISQNMFGGGISGKMFNKMLGGAMKMLEKEMQKVAQPQNKELKTNFELYINGKRINPANIKVTKKPVGQPIENKVLQNTSSGSLKKFSSLPKKEPLTNIRRLADKVIYEIDIPGVKSIKDVSIVKLENSIEIKAVAKDKAYKKIIGIDLPILAYKLDKEKLVLELGVKG